MRLRVPPLGVLLGLAIFALPRFLSAAGTSIADDKLVIELALKASDGKQVLAVRLNAIKAIGMIGSKSTYSVPLLIDLLDAPSATDAEKNIYVQAVVEALDAIGPNARPLFQRS